MRTYRFLSRSAAAAALAVGMLANAPEAAACYGEDYIGTLCKTASEYCWRGTEPASGQVLQISQYRALFDVIGDAYGGDGKTTFALPDLNEEKPDNRDHWPGIKTCVVIDGPYPPRPVAGPVDDPVDDPADDPVDDPVDDPAGGFVMPPTVNPVPTIGGGAEPDFGT